MNAKFFSSVRIMGVPLKGLITPPRALLFLLATVVKMAVIAILLSACSPSLPNARLQVRSLSYQTGGTLVISGSNFEPGGTVHLVAVNPPGSDPSHPTLLDLTNAAYEPDDPTVASDGTFTVSAHYEWNPPLDHSLPGCAVGSTSSVDVLIQAIEVVRDVSNTVMGTVNVLNCGPWVNPVGRWTLP